MDTDKAMLGRLEQMAAFHAREAERYRTAAEVVRVEIYGAASPKPQTLEVQHKADASVMRNGTKGRSGSPRRGGPTGTMAMIPQVLGNAPAPITLAKLTELMLEAGWETTSGTPSNTLRTALLRMQRSGEVVRDKVGRYAMSPTRDVAKVHSELQPTPGNWIRVSYPNDSDTADR